MRFRCANSISIFFRSRRDRAKLNVATFTFSGIAATVPAIAGEPYLDASGCTYLPMFRQPVLVFEAGLRK
jgi:hypothetical protein